MRLPLLRYCPIALVLFSTAIGICQNFNIPAVIRSGNVTSTAQADLNDDGKYDLVYLEGTPQATVHSLLNAGNGKFSDAQTVQLPMSFGGKITMADVNGDAKIDLLIGSWAADIQVVVLLGNGDGTFGTPMISDLGPATPNWSVIRSGFGVADLNHDGNMDLVAPDAQDGYVYVLLGDGTGKFSLSSKNYNGSAPADIVSLDLNRDGNPDFVIRGALGADVYVYLGNSNGTLQMPARYTGTHYITSFLLYDIDGDGVPDMVVTNQAYGIEIFRGHLDGTFDATSEGGIAETGSWLTLLTAGDFNGDGIPDLYATSTDGLMLLVGKAGLSFNLPVPYASPSSNCTVADMNGDGHLDIVSAYDTGVSILRGNADGSLQTTDTYSSGSYSTARLGDFNHDGWLDIALVGDPNKVPVLINDGSGKFHLNQPPNATTTYIYPVAAITGDFNGDGRSDLLTQGNSFTNVQFADTSGILSAPVQVPLWTNATPNPYGALAVGDFNQDGRTDVVNPPYLLLGQNNNSFITQSSGGGIQWVSRRAADMNKDGHPDLVFGGYHDIEVSLGDGTGRLTNTGRSYDTSIVDQINIDMPTSIDVADIDGDGNLDVATTISSGPYVEIFYGKGDGTLENAQLITVDRNYSKLFLSDVDHDGLPDLVLNQDSTISLFRHTGARTFGGAVRYSIGSGLIDVTDMNGDSLPDLVIQNGPGTVAIAYNHPGPGTIAGGMTVQPEPSEQTKPITLTLTLVVAQGKAAPTGTVSFGLDGFQITTLPLTGTVMTYVYTNTGNLELGKHIFSAVYSGDANYQPGSFAVKHTMVPLQLATAINLSASATTSLTGQAVVFTAKVTAISGTKIPFGMIAFHDGQTNLGTRYLDNNGVAVFDTGLLQIGTHTITAVFAANPYFGASQSNPVTVQINSVTTSISLAAIPNPAPAGSAVQLTAQVSSLSGVPNGAVTFYDGTTALETRTVGSDGIASLGTTFTSGTHSLSASYAANGMWGGSSSGLTVTSNVAGSSSSVLDGKADFAVKLSAYEGVASRGVPYQMDVKVRALWGFKEDVHLTCAVSDPGAECNFEHPLLTNASGASRLTVLLKSSVAGAEVHKSNRSGGSAMPILATLLGFILLAPTRKLRQRLLALLCASVLLFSLACGQGAAPPGGTVKVTVTAASGTGQAATIHSEVVNVKIKTF